ncbi:MAG: ABC transporter ATP-binding protein [Eubacterium sp.]
MDILKVSNISKSFGDRTIIKDINLTLKKGELISLLGVSGSGKTTLFNSISGIDTPDSGTVELAGKDVTGQPGHISYMLQKDLLLPYKKIIDNVSLPLLLSGVKKKEARAEAKKHFAEFGIEGTENKYPSELSGGMRQRAALLRTYLASDGVALLDEPFSALDTITKHSMHSWYLSVMEKIDLSTIFITHDIDEAIILSDRILILSGSPGNITDEIVISEPKPREKDFNLTPQFLEYKKQIISSLGVTSF